MDLLQPREGLWLVHSQASKAKSNPRLLKQGTLFASHFRRLVKTTFYDRGGSIRQNTSRR